MQVQTIQSFLELSPHINENATTVLAVDFDNTLGQCKVLLGSDRTYNLFSTWLHEQGYNQYGHYDWFNYIRTKSSFIPCESGELIKNFFCNLRKKNIHPIVITARKSDAKELTKSHLEQVNHEGFNIKNTFFCVDKEEVYRTKKEILADWITQNFPDNCTEVLFIDDSDTHCNNLLTLSQSVPNCQIKVFRYSGSIYFSKDPFTEKEMNALSGQLKDLLDNAEIRENESCFQQTTDTVDTLFNRFVSAATHCGCPIEKLCTQSTN